MRIGIFFGGRSREREISFAGGRTVYDNLDKSLFSPIPIFVDSLGNFILLDWKYLYKGTIRDFYPKANLLPQANKYFQVYAESVEETPDIIAKSIAEIGIKIQPEDFKNHFDFAFLTLHGPYGEDGNIQGLLDWYDIPYSGAGILPSGIGIDKAAQRQMLNTANLSSPKSMTVSRIDWENNPSSLIKRIEGKFQYPIVIKAPHQGSSIGVNIVKNIEELRSGIERSFFILNVNINDWKKRSEDSKYQFLIDFTDIRIGLGFPIIADNRFKIDHPQALWEYLDNVKSESCKLEAVNGEAFILIESFIQGREFSCIVIEDENGKPIALPPTEIKKNTDLYDYRSKYLPGISRKVTPIDLPIAEIQKIRTQCQELYSLLHSDVYARIDGFYTSNGEVFLNDPNTTSGMLPSSFFFHQAAEIGLNPSQFLTFITERSLKARYKTGKNLFLVKKQIDHLHQAMKELNASKQEKIRVGVIMGGFSSERHISIESGRNIYEKLASSSKYEAIPIFLTGNENEHEMFVLPINIMLKDNADDIKHKINSPILNHDIIELINYELKETKSLFIGNESILLKKVNYQELHELIDFAFIALHGRPGEDGAVQKHLEKVNIPYNGSGVASSQLTINKFETNKKLRDAGILVANHTLIFEEDFTRNKEACIDHIEAAFQYPFIAKPADDGCSSAVKKIKSKMELVAFCEMMFRTQEDFLLQPSQILQLKSNEEFPQKSFFLIEDLISANGAEQFLEITGGVVTHLDKNGDLEYEAFNPSEALASGEILSLEEKFLAGEGQNITPARFGRSESEYDWVASQVKRDLIKTAQICSIEGYCRIDAFVRIYKDKVETIVIEINSLPGMTPATAIFHQAALNNQKPYDFIDSIISFGTQRFLKNQQA